MTHIHDDIQNAKNSVETAQDAKNEQKTRQEQKTKITERQMNEILYAIAQDLISGDSSHLVQMEVKEPGFEILFVNRGAHNPTPFSVSATCKEDTVELHISDGKWENSPNVAGNWGHWSDDKVVYSGAANESKIYKIISESFLTWYNKSLQ